MKTALKVVAVLLVLLALLIGGAVLILRDSRPTNQSIVFSDGSELRYLGTTVGTNHVYRTALQRIAEHFPDSISSRLLKIARQKPIPQPLHTGKTTIVVWAEHSGPPATTVSVSRNALLRVPGEPFGGVDQHVYFSLGGVQTNRIHSIQFESWPRRAERIECVLMEKDSNYHNVPVGSFHFENPLQSDVPPWSPDPVPLVESADDLEVTLLDFATGVGNSTTHRRNSNGGYDIVYNVATNDPRSVVRVEFNSPRGTNEVWQMFNADLSDATGNNVGARSRSGMTDRMVFGPVLWPDEAAWKLKLHLKRKSGFQAGELLSFTNIAVPAPNQTNVVNQTNSLKGIKTIFKHLIVRPPLKDPHSWSSGDLSEIRLEHDALGETNQIDLVSITVQPMGTNLTTSGSSWSDDYHEYNLESIPANATHLDFVFAVQKARFVEFNVAPNWITNDYVIQAE